MNKYTVKYDILKKNIEELLRLNYTASKPSFMRIVVKELYVIDDEDLAAIHTKNRYNSPILHVDIYVTYNYIITKTEKNFSIHEDIKLDSLTVGDINE